MARVFLPRDDRDRTYLNFLKRYSQSEIILGGLLLFIGGFNLRVSGELGSIILGAVLMSLGLIHFVQFSRGSRGDGSYADDRILNRLRRDLPEGYTVAVDFPLNHAEADYLVIGPTGLFVVSGCSARGYLEGRPGDDSWVHQPPNQAGKQTLKNPHLENSEAVNELKKRLAKAELYRSLTPRNMVVLLYHRVEGPALENRTLCRLGELTDRIQAFTPPGGELSWEEVEELEEIVGLSST